MMAYSEDHIALAAEYALGTLDADERTQVETMMAVDKEFTAIVQAWEFRLGVLNQMVGSVEPRPIVWENIRRAIGHAEPQAPLVLPEAPPATPPMVAANDDRRNGDAARARAGRGQFERHPAGGPRPRWRNVASVTSAIAAALVVMLSMQVYQPDLSARGHPPEAAHPDGRGQDAGTAGGRAICRAAAERRQLARLHPDGRRGDQEFYRAQGRRPARARQEL